MPSPYDILGTVFGVLSLLGCVRCAYGFLKARQPFAQVVRLEDSLRATRQRIDEVERYRSIQRGDLTAAALHWHMRAALVRIDEESLSVRRKVRITRPKTIAAVLLYTVQYGINSKHSRRICQWTKQVSFVRYQVDFPYEWSSGSSRIRELGTGVETSPPSGVEGTFNPPVATSSGMEVLAVPEATLTHRSRHSPPPRHRPWPWTDGMRLWREPPKTVHGWDRLGVIDLLRRIWRAHWNNGNTPGSDATPQDDSQDSEELAVVYHWTARGTGGPNSTYNAPVRRGAVTVVRAARGGRRM